MAQLIVRNLEDDVKAKLKRRARRHGHSMEQEARDILRAAVADQGRPGEGLGTRLRSCFKRAVLTEPLEKLPPEPPRPATFDD